MTSFFKVGSSLISSLAQSLHDHINDSPSTSSNDPLLNHPQDLNYIQHGGRGVLVFYLIQDLPTNPDHNLPHGSGHGHGRSGAEGGDMQKILHLNYERNLLILFKIPSHTHLSPTTSGGEKYPSQAYLCSKISSVKRLSPKSIQIDLSSTRQPLVFTFRNEPDSNQFLKFLLNLFFYSDTILSAFKELALLAPAAALSAPLLAPTGIAVSTECITTDGLFAGFKAHHIEEVSQENVQSIFSLPSPPPSSSASPKLDYINFFELLLDIPVYSTFDCLIGLLSRIGLNDLSFTPYQEPLLLGEVIVKHIPHTRWLICQSDLDVNSPHSPNDRVAWFGSLLFTNYRLIFYCRQRRSFLHSKSPLPIFFNKISIPLNSIAKTTISNEPSSLTQHIRLNVITKDGKLIRLIFIKDFSYTQAVVLHRQLLNGTFLSSPQRMFCFHYQQTFQANGWKFSNVRYDFERLGLLSDPEWTAIENHRGSLIETYPSLLIVPSRISREMIQQCISFRSLGRFPVVTYRHQATQCCLSRSGQPIMSQSNACVQSDRELLDAYRTSGIFNQLR
jgi:hypothetical protein